MEKYTRVDGSEDEDGSVAGGDEVATYSDAEFIDDDDEKTNIQRDSSTDYCLMNVTMDFQEALLNQ